jgi:NAD(P)-dependent dehydrogenase (short-subunit alcohol dehydrogenase family)
VVTGTANPRGLGFATARRFAQLGCRVVLADLDGNGVSVRAEELRSTGADVLAVRTDMSDRSSVEELADTTYDRFGATHILLLNHVAPTGRPGHGLLNPAPDAWELHTRVNLLGAVYGIKAFVPRMIASGVHGHVLATSSGAGATGTMYGNGPYAVTKAAITSLMECLYGQLRDAGADIVASLVFPPVTDTSGVEGRVERTVEMLRANGMPACALEPENVAEFTVEAIQRDSFWARPDLSDDERLTGGKRRENIEWESEIYRTRAETIIARGAPDPYLWGPPSNLLGS